MGESGLEKCVDIFKKILKPLNFIGGLGTVAVAVFYLLVVPFTFRSMLNLFFTGTLGVLLVAGDFNLETINQNCKFLTTFIGRGLYNVFVGAWIYGLHALFVDDGIQALFSLVSFIVYLVSVNYNVFIILFLRSSRTQTDLVF